MDCIVCCEPLEILARYQCGHNICHRCAAKLLYLYDDSQCPLCKSRTGKPLFTDTDAEHLKHSEEQHCTPENGNGQTSQCTFMGCSLNSTERVWTKEDDHACYSSDRVFSFVQNLLLKKCIKCKAVFQDSSALEEHYRKRHSCLVCDICLAQGHQFWFEMQIYTPEKLARHKKGQLSEPGFSGHVYCVHCEKYLYNMDEAKKHCHLQHQLCTVCGVLGIRQQYYSNYKALEEHYKARHYCCTDPACVKNLCYVYAYKSELWTHSLIHHSRDIKLTDISTGLSPNPPVCSLDTNSEANEDSFYPPPVNIVSPLVNEPFFPSFASSEEESQNSQVPAYMNRSIIHQAESIARNRLSQIRMITNIFASETNESIEKFLNGSKTIQDVVSEIEAGVGGQVCLRVLESVSFMHRGKEVREFLKTYRQSVIFPVFKKEEPFQKPRQDLKKGGSLGGFKVLDLTTKKL